MTTEAGKEEDLRSIIKLNGHIEALNSRAWRRIREGKQAHRPDTTLLEERKAQAEWRFLGEIKYE